MKTRAPRSINNRGSAPAKNAVRFCANPGINKNEGPAPIARTGPSASTASVKASRKPSEPWTKLTTSEITCGRTDTPNVVCQNRKQSEHRADNRSMTAKLPSAPTPAELAKVWTAQLAGVLREAANGEEIDRAGVAKIAARSDEGRLLADNVLNYLDATGKDAEKIETLIAAGYRYVLSNGERVASPATNKISLVGARQMQADLVPDFFALRGKEIAGTSGKAVQEELAKVAGDVTLGLLGEDSGTYTKAVFRKGPIDSLTAENALRLFGFKVDTQLAADTFSFQKYDPKDPDLWTSFVEFQDDASIGEAVKKLLSAANVLELASMVVEDNRPFGAPAFLLARLDDGSVVGLRGDIGGMSL
jgi:hypothetical protein